VALGWNLQVAGNIAESAVVDQPAEAQGPDLSLADLLVAVHARAERFHAVVEVESPQPFDAQYFIELLERFVISAVRRNVVSGREDVAGVEADGDAIRTLAALADRAQLLESPTQRIALTGGRLQQHQAGPAMAREDAVEGIGDGAQPPLRLGARARMHDQVGRSDQIAALQLVEEGSDRLLPQFPCDAAQIDEIAGVHAGVKSRRLCVLAKKRGILGGDLLRPPHPARLGEDLDGFGAVGESARVSFVQTARGRLMGAEEQGLTRRSPRACATSRSSRG